MPRGVLMSEIDALYQAFRSDWIRRSQNLAPESKCNPQLHAEHLAEAIEDLRAENDRLRAALQKIADHSYDGSLVGWKRWKTLAHEALHEPPSAAQQQGTDIYSGIY